MEEPPQLMIRIPKRMHLVVFKEEDVKPTLRLDCLHTPKLYTLSTRDQLYFKFKKTILQSPIRSYILHEFYKDLLKCKTIPANVYEHFHPLHVLSHTWWNKTHSYIYFYPDICTMILELLGRM
jgi:hypothetical protein